jgi:hypothetical protein
VLNRGALHAGVWIRHVLLIIPAVLCGLLHPVTVSLLLGLHQRLGLSLRALWYPVWKGASLKTRSQAF